MVWPKCSGRGKHNCVGAAMDTPSKDPQRCSSPHPPIWQGCPNIDCRKTPEDVTTLPVFEKAGVVQ